MRWLLFAFLFGGAPLLASSPCLVYLENFAAGDPLLRATLSKMAGRWDFNEEWISYQTGAILGGRTSAPRVNYAARIPSQDEPVEIEELQAIDLVTAVAVEYELNTLYLGPFANARMRAQLRGETPSHEAIIGLFPHPAHQAAAAHWLQNHADLSEAPRSVITQGDLPVFDALQAQTSSIHFGRLGSLWGSLDLAPEGVQYRLVVYGTGIDQTLGPMMGLLIRGLFATPALRHVQVEIPAKLAFLVDPESFDRTGTTSLHDLGPRELGLRCDELAGSLATFVGAPFLADGPGYVLRLPGYRTVSLVFVP